MKRTIVLLIAVLWRHWAFAELPKSLDEVLFGISGGTNYVKWMRTDGTLKFDRPFVVFNLAHFRMHYPTNDFAPRHYSIEMEREFPNESSSTNLVELIQKAESILLKSFKGRSFKRQYDGTRYQSSCVDIDGLGWDACFYVIPVAGVANMCFVARSRFYNPLHKEGRFVSCEDFNKCKWEQGDSPVVVASTPAFSNVCKAVGASIHVLDLRNISQKDLIWITEGVDLILATRDFTREELDRIAKAVSVECVNWDYEDVSPKGVEHLTSIIHKHREERRICVEILGRRSKMSDEERIAEYYALIEKEDCGPFQFKEALALDVFTGVLQRINANLGPYSEFLLSGSYSSKDETMLNRRYTLSIPRMPPMKMLQYVSEQMNCTFTNRNGFIEMEQLNVIDAPGGPHGH